MKFFRRILDALAPAPLSLFDRFRRAPDPKLSSLFVVEFAATPDQATIDKLNSVLEPIEKKYGIDFIPLEPGIRIRRFEEL
jgi:hypothetical protein